MKWIKGLGSSLWVGILAVGAAMAAFAAMRHKQTADKWRDKAVDIETGNVVKGVETAKAANTQAKLHDNKAKALEKKAKERTTKYFTEHRTRNKCAWFVI